MKRVLPYLILFFYSTLLIGQKQGNNWYFGTSSGLSFNGGSPSTLSSGVTGSDIPNNYPQEGTASISDSTGALLFYTGGKTIWNKFNQPMPNGSNMMGGTSSTQSSIIIPKPGNDTLFYVFTSDEFQNLPAGRGYRYSIVNICLDAGKGDVVANKKNILLADSCTEKLAACRDAAGTGYWIVGHKMYSDKFIAWHLTAMGITNTVTSNIGSLHGWFQANSTWVTGNALGQMKINSAGTKLALAIGNNQTSILDLFDFNNSNGTVSSFCHMNLDSALHKWIYGVEFSNNGSKLYASVTAGSGGTRVYQFDLNAGGCSAVISSSLAVYQDPSGSIGLLGMQIGPDKKIYIAAGSGNLSCINSPDQLGPACGFVLNAISISGINYYTLPSFIAGYNYSNTINPCCANPTIQVTAPAAICPSLSAQLSASGANSYSWQPGGQTGSSISVSPTVTTTYTVMGITGGCIATYTKTVNVYAFPTLGINNATVCGGMPSILSITGSSVLGMSYTWFPGSIPGPSISVSPAVNSNYTLVATNALCNFSTSVTNTVTVHALPILSISGTNTLCAGSSVTQTASGALTYTWNTGSNNSSVSLSPTVTGNYFVIGTDVNGCKNGAATTITVFSTPAINVNNYTICSGSQATVSMLNAAEQGVVYTWLPGASNNTFITVSPQTTSLYTLVASQALCNFSASVTSTVTVIPITTPNPGFNYLPVCENSNGSISPSNVSAFYPTGIFSSADINVDPVTGNIAIASIGSGTYSITYSIAATGCTTSAIAIASLVVMAAPNITVSPNATIFQNASTTLSVSGGTSYTWSPANYLSCVNCENPVATPPENMQYCVTSQLNSCTSKACIDITVNCETNTDYSMPTAFTPNGDGNNDTFCLQGWSNCITIFNILIFDRWGEKVFESNDPAFCWDGYYKGKLMDAAVFVFVIKAKKFNSAESLNKKGNITLIR